jgi:hypothetical protein
MAPERLMNTALPHTLSEVVSDLADLFQKEMRLVRAELSDKIATKVSAGIWMSVAGLMALIAGVLIAEAAVFAIVAYGIALPWACLIVAGVLLAIAMPFYARGRAAAREEFMPTRTINQMKRDVSRPRSS